MAARLSTLLLICSTASLLHMTFAQTPRRPGATQKWPPKQLGSVKGPAKTDKILVAGNDSASVHMTYLLQKAGYDVVHLLNGPVPGADTESIYLPRSEMVPFPFDMGTNQGYIGKNETYINQLLKDIEYPWGFRDVPPVSIWDKPHQVSSLFRHTMDDVKEYKPSLLTLPQQQQELIQLLKRYKRLHIEMFGSYDYDQMILPPEPNARFKDRLNTSIEEFLTKHKLTPLHTIFNLVISAHGFGKTNEVPMLYGSMLITPKVIEMLIKYYSTNPELANKYAFFHMLDKGLDSIWNWMARREALPIKRNHNVYKILANYDQNKVLSNYTVYYRKSNCKKYKRTVNFLVLSNDVKAQLKTIVNATKKEMDTFENVKYNYVTASIAKFAVTKHCLTRDMFLKNILSTNISHDVFTYRSAITSGKGMCAAANINQLNQFHYGIFYQFQREDTPKRTSYKSLKSFMQHHGLVNADVFKQKVKKTAPRFPKTEVAEGVLHDIWGMQGENMIWYIGPQVSMDCLDCMLRYNQQLINKAAP